MPALTGRFPYGETATVSSSGRIRKERFRPGAFARAAEPAFDQAGASARAVAELSALQAAARADLIGGDAVSDSTRNGINGLRRQLEPARRNPDVSLLRGHSFDQPLAQTSIGSLELRDTADALLFRAFLPRENMQPAYLTDAIRMLEAGLLVGLSPGFRPPPRGGVRTVHDPGEPAGVMTREVSDAVLLELSLVSRPAFKDSSIDMDRRSIYVADLELVTDELQLRSELGSDLGAAVDLPAPGRSEPATSDTLPRTVAIWL